MLLSLLCLGSCGIKNGARLGTISDWIFGSVEIEDSATGDKLAWHTTILSLPQMCAHEDVPFARGHLVVVKGTCRLGMRTEAEFQQEFGRERKHLLMSTFCCRALH